VAGAAVGSRLAGRLGVADRVTDWLGVTDRRGVTDPDADGLGLALAEALAVALGKVVGVGESVPAGENEEDGPAAGVDREQAETAAKASTMPQPMRINLALRAARAKVGGTFTEPFR
jgi:hypothetical protein